MLVTSSCAKGLPNPRGTLDLVVLPLSVSEALQLEMFPITPVHHLHIQYGTDWSRL
jgi:hypothetical protein